MSKPRQCGECHACCDRVAVESIVKPANTPCPLAQAFNGHGCCSVHGSQPSECATYKCSWLHGHVPAEWRPDQRGILFESGHIDWPRRIIMLHGFELRPGAIEENRRYLQTIFRPGMVANMVNFDETKVESFGREDDVHDVRMFFAMCRREGGLTVRMNDRDVQMQVKR